MKFKAIFILLIAIMIQVWLTGSALAATYPQPPADSPFTLVGFIQAATLDNPSDVLSGGTVTVNGTTVVIPKNTIVVVSATNISWQELWSLAPCPWGLGHAVEAPGTNGICPGNGLTGLALSDVDPGTGAKPLTTFEINIMGNRIVDPKDGQDKYVAGLVYLAQQSLNLGQGVINYIDYATATLHVGCPTLGQPCPAGQGARIQINDPVGRYGRPMSPDPRFTGDTDNPTITSQTAYPMCIPRDPSGADDPLCPRKNRPLDPASTTGAPLGNFTLCNPNPVLLPGATTPTVQACVANTPPSVLGVINAKATVDPIGDSTLQAPFMVGDYIEYSGNLYPDATGLITGVTTGQYISAWQVIDKVGIYTSPRTIPAYVNIQLILLGVGGTPITSPIAVPEELTTRIRARGFFTDPTRTVDVFATQVDPCTGVETDVLMLANIPNQKGGIPWGRWRDFDQAGLFPVTKQWRIRYTPIFTDPIGPLLAANNLTVMQFQIPVAQYILPENTIYGDPTLLTVPNNFQDFPFLVNGMGPWRGDPNHIVGQLAPFPLTNSIPGLTPPAPAGPTVICGTNATPPVVVISPLNQTVKSNDKVTLDASKSYDKQGLTLPTFSWTQTGFGGLPPVTLNNANTAVATFQAPKVTVDTPLEFQVNVTNTANLTAAGSTEIMVKPGPVATDTVIITGVTYRSNTGVLNVSATSSDITCSAILTLTAFASNTVIYGPINMTVSNLVVGGCSYNLVSGKAVFPAPTSVTVVSSEGGFAACPSGTCSIKFK
jgi:hypothetical protein